MVHAIMPGDTQRRTGRMPSWKALARCDFVWPIHDVPIEKFAFGDRTIPIHARTLGVSVPPHVMGGYYGTVQSAVVHTN